MEDSQHKKTCEELETQLVKELETMRDALTTLALTMSDLKFLVDVPQRAAARKVAADCLMRTQSDQK